MSINIYFLKNLIIAGRPKQWTKNLLVFSAVFFSQEQNNGTWLLAIITFICFCFISSSIYFLNDSLDVEEDKKHPTKCQNIYAKKYLVSIFNDKTFISLMNASENNHRSILKGTFYDILYSYKYIFLPSKELPKS